MANRSRAEAFHSADNHYDALSVSMRQEGKMDWGKSALEFGRMKWRAMAVAPRDGTYIRLKFRPLMEQPRPEIVGQWQAHDEMPAGGAWFDHEGNYITPGPIEWAPETGSANN